MLTLAQDGLHGMCMECVTVHDTVAITVPGGGVDTGRQLHPHSSHLPCKHTWTLDMNLILFQPTETVLPPNGKGGGHTFRLWLSNKKLTTAAIAVTWKNNDRIFLVA